MVWWNTGGDISAKRAKSIEFQQVALYNKCQLVKKGRYLIQMKEDPERNKDEVIGGRRRSRIKSGDCSVIRRRDGCAEYGADLIPGERAILRE